MQPTPANHDFPITVLGPATFRKDVSQAVKACARCHERKIKCNTSGLVDGAPCRNCLKAQVECRRHRDGRNKNIPSRASSQTTLQSGSVEGTPLPKHTEDVNSLQQYVPTPISGVHSVGTASEYSHSGDTYAFSDDVEGVSYEMNDSNVTLSPDFIGGMSQQRSDQRVVHPNSQRFEAFVEDHLGSFAPIFVSHRNSQQDEPFSNGDVTGEIPARFDVDLGTRSTLDIERQFINLDSTDMDYLRAKGAFDLPPRHLQEDMVNAYFTHVNPIAPIINRTAFLQQFQQNQISSRLLLFAIFTAGCKACNNPLLMDQQGTKLGTGLKYFKITKALLDTGYEQDKIVQIQALLLITYWWDRKDDGGKNMRGCAINAINIAQSMGMSRWDHYPKSDSVLLGLWKRVWWGCVIRDATVSTTVGLPTVLDLVDSDVYPLTPEDFIEEPGLHPNTQSFPYSTEDISFYIHEAKLSELLGIVHSTQFYMYRLHEESTGSISKREAAIHDNILDFHTYYDRLSYSFDSLADCARLCGDWYTNVPAELYYDVDNIHGHRFWPAYLHIIFFTILCTQYREKSVSKAIGAEALTQKHWCQAQGIAAATMLAKIIRNLKAHGQILKCSGFLTHALFNCLIFCLIEGQSPDQEVRNYAQQKYSLCLNTLYDFSQLWVSASMIHRLFEVLQASINAGNPATGSKFTRYYAQYLANTRVSSEVGNETMKRLLASRPPFESSYGSDSSLTMQSSEGMATNTPSSFYLESLPPEFYADNAELPGSLEVQKWCEFFNLGKL